MSRRNSLSLILLLLPFLLSGTIRWTMAQGSQPNIRVNVELVQLNVAVMDRKGNYVDGLRPSDFEVTEDGIPQRIANFGEGNEATRTLVDVGPAEARSPRP
jgi:hypothetical protein